VRHTSARSQPKTLPGKQDNVSAYEQNKIILTSGIVFFANRDNFSPYEQVV
jgi:hypothetical protein